MLRMRFVGPPRATLSGATLQSGVDAESLELAGHASFYGELTAQPELRHFNAPARRADPPADPSFDGDNGGL